MDEWAVVTVRSVWSGHRGLPYGYVPVIFKEREAKLNKDVLQCTMCVFHYIMYIDEDVDNSRIEKRD